MNVLYSTTATAKGGRAGQARTADGVLDVSLSVPKELGGDGGPGTNPEQLFAAGYAACFESALRHVAGEQKKTIDDASVTATVGIGPREEGGFGLAVELEVSLKGMSKSEAEELVDFVHSTICPYSNATRGNVDVTTKLV
ncbi:MAG TPA: organic hydroperoxide resistance protein [Alphaproteobacteria bacterium]|nr:organic hydroperoxide resistance protein [Alphaproteobacteria bacterium]